MKDCEEILKKIAICQKIPVWDVHKKYKCNKIFWRLYKECLNKKYTGINFQNKMTLSFPKIKNNIK